MCDSADEINDMEIIKSVANDIKAIDGVRTVKISEYRCVVVEVNMTEDAFCDRDITDKIYTLEYNALRQQKSKIGFDVRLNIASDA